MLNYDIIIIGAGSAGFSAAIEAASMGARVALIDGSDPIGGTCILRGCMPSKTLLQSAKVADTVRKAGEFGVRINGDVEIDYPFIHARTQELVDGWAKYRYEQIITNPNITLVREWGEFVDERTVRAGESLLTSERIMITSGSSPRVPSVKGLEEAGYVTSDDALWLDKLPKSIATIGAGVVGVEIGQFMNRMGVDVTILEQESRILIREDNDVAIELTRALEEDGIKVIAGVTPKRVEVVDGKKRVYCTERGRIFCVEAEEILVSAGRVANTEMLHLDRAGVMVDALGNVVVDQSLRTTNPNIYAAGDVTGRTNVVHCAVNHGALAARNALKGVEQEDVECRLRLQIIFTDPEVASIGIGEQEALLQGKNVLTAQYPFAEHGKAVLMGKTAGFVKIIADAASGEILGIKIIGPEASELIHEAMVLMHFRATVHQLAAMSHYHPTLAEIITYPAEELATLIQMPEHPIPAWI